MADRAGLADEPCRCDTAPVWDLTCTPCLARENAAGGQPPAGGGPGSPAVWVLRDCATKQPITDQTFPTLAAATSWLRGHGWTYGTALYGRDGRRCWPVTIHPGDTPMQPTRPTTPSPDVALSPEADDASAVIQALLLAGTELWNALAECGVADAQRDSWDAVEERAGAFLDRVSGEGGARG